MPFDFEKFADTIEKNLQGHCIGYTFVVSYKDDWKKKRSGGKARTSRDFPPTDMGPAVPFHTASVSKAITAAAMLHVLNKREDVSLDSVMHPYLPDHWTIHETKRKTTFRQLLTHRSGYTPCDHDYASLKKFMAKAIPGVNDNSSSQHAYDYVGTNYSLMRFLIPALAKSPIFQMKKADAAQETIQAGLYASAYIDYVNKNLFKKAGLPAMGCKALPLINGMCYQFPYNDKSGTDFGDQTLTCAAKGWVLSAQAMAKFFRILHHTEKILPAWLSKKMREESLGYDTWSTTAGGTHFYRKGGYYPGSKNPGELHTITIGYENEVQVALIVNSDLTGGKDLQEIINSAFDGAQK